jgi:mannose-6-phosphate isomerase-like protein (cupin superfamily)
MGKLHPGERRDFMTTKINLDQKFGLFDEQWRPKVIAAMNGQEIKLVKVKGEFPWHRHQQEDEFFLVWKGRFRVEFRDHIVEMSPGECVVVPRGVEHRTCADEERKFCSSNRREPSTPAMSSTRTTPRQPGL